MANKFEALRNALELNSEILVEEVLQLGVSIHTIENCAYIEVQEGFIKLDRENETVSLIRLTLAQ